MARFNGYKGMEEYPRMILGLYSFLLISVEKLLRDGLGSRSNTVNPKNENKKPPVIGRFHSL